MRPGWWSIGMALLVACGPAIPPLPSRGGPAWLEVRSAYFTLWTDAPAERAHELMRELELRRQLLVTAMHHESSTARAFVIALRSSRETGEYLPHDAIAVAWDDRNPTSQPGILLAADNDDGEHVVSHELTHVISFGFLKNQPHWLAEGIATYFEMADLESGERAVQVGLPRGDRAAPCSSRGRSRPPGCSRARNPAAWTGGSMRPAGRCSRSCSTSASTSSIATCSA